MTDTMTDVELFKCAQSGDDAAFTELCNRFRDRLTGSIVGWLRDHRLPLDLADDVLQATFRTSLRALDTVDHVPNWMWRVMWYELERAQKRHRVAKRRQSVA